jgi:hypothetical protein
VGVPGPPGADLVVVEPGFALGLLEALFNRPLLMPVKRKPSLA